MKNTMLSIIFTIDNFLKRADSYTCKNVILAKFPKVGNNFSFDPYSTFVDPGTIKIGNNVFIGEKAYISANLTIGDNVMIGPRVTVIGRNHVFGIKGERMRFLKAIDTINSNPIIIEDDVWLGANVTILQNVTLGTGSIIGACSVVTKSIPPYTIAVGNSCKPIIKIFNDKNLFEHLILLGCNTENANVVLAKRNQLLQEYGLLDLPCVDNTADYRGLG